MPVPLRLEREIDPEEATARAIMAGLEAYNDFVCPGGDWKPLWIVGRDETGEVRSGLRGLTEFRWLFVTWLWVAEPWRGQGFGSRMLADAESVARERGCGSCYLDTFSFQAPDFYKRLGYREFGRLTDFPPGHTRIWLWKSLS